MRRLLIPLVPVCLLSFMAVPLAGAVGVSRKASMKCSSGRSHVVVADAQAQVYEAPETPQLPGYLDLFGCVYGQHKSYLLGSPLSGGSPSVAGGVSNEVLVGSIVAYGKSFVQSEPGSTSYLVIVRDLRNGRVLHDVPTGTSNPPYPTLVGDGPTTAIVVKSDGAVAWIVENLLKYEVHALDKTGNRVLASGSDIEPHSLALAGSTLYWMQGGKPMSAVLH
jgi:hypothetical protein